MEGTVRRTDPGRRELLVFLAPILFLTTRMQEHTEKASKTSGIRNQERPPRGVRRPVFRRNLLFFATLTTLVLVFLGAVPFSGSLASRPLSFAVFWGGCFLLAGFILALAIYDLARVRHEHRLRARELEKELAEVAAEAREAARQLREETNAKPDGEESG